MVRVLQVTDTHLSARVPSADENWAAVVAAVPGLGVDLVVHTGDITRNGAEDPDELTLARERLDRLEVPWLAVPGNHDIGDVGHEAHPLTVQRRGRYEALFGPGFWAEQLGAWRLVGIDSQTLAETSDIAAERWEWVAAQLDGAAPTALFMHRPLRPLTDVEVDAPNRYLNEPARGRLAALLDLASVRLVACGHVHQWRILDRAGRRHVWAPAVWASLPESKQPTMGTKTVGAVVHELGDDAVSHLVLDDELVHHVVGETIPMPYDLEPAPR